MMKNIISAVALVLALPISAQAAVNENTLFRAINSEIDAAALQVTGQRLDPNAPLSIGGSGHRILYLAIPRILRDVPGSRAPKIDYNEEGRLFSSETNLQFLQKLAFDFLKANGQ